MIDPSSDIQYWGSTWCEQTDSSEAYRPVSGILSITIHDIIEGKLVSHRRRKLLLIRPVVEPEHRSAVHD